MSGGPRKITPPPSRNSEGLYIGEREAGEGGEAGESGKDGKVESVKIIEILE